MTPARPLPLIQRISELRHQGVFDPLPALVADAHDPQDLFNDLGVALQMPVMRLQSLASWTPAFERFSFADAARHRFALLEHEHRLLMMVTDPFDVDAIAWARTRFGALEVALASAETFDAWLTQCESGLSAMGSVRIDIGEVSMQADAEVLSLTRIGTDDSPAVRFVNSTLYDALKAGASDIHLESDATGLAVKFRLDGALTAVRRVESRDLAAQSISRIKVMAQLDIAERRVPQDGRLQIEYSGRPVDVRVSIMPSIHGEDCVLRVLDRQHLAESLAGLTLAKLGFQEDSAKAFKALCRKPHGMLLVTGPTGSGKTTTLYAAIAETHQSRDKIITIEDPVEYQLTGVLQIPVNERKGLTFARGLRSILRHDPDKILVGEIRDSETAQIAVQSALTGHLVFTTVHANGVFDVLGRFEQFGIDAYTFAAAMNGVLAQRLLRRLCPRCAQADGSEPSRGPGNWLKAVGCEHCRGTGYAGRFVVGELLAMTPVLKSLFAERAPMLEIQHEATKGGWRRLSEAACDAARSGLTTWEEVERVAD